MQSARSERYGWVLLAVWVLGVLSPVCTIPAHADVQPGTTVTAANVDSATDLLSPGMEWCVRRGWDMPVVAPKRVHLLHGYATELAADLTTRGYEAHAVPGHSGPAEGEIPGMFKPRGG